MEKKKKKKKNYKKRNHDAKELESMPSFAAQLGYVFGTHTAIPWGIWHPLPYVKLIYHLGGRFSSSTDVCENEVWVRLLLSEEKEMQSRDL